MPYCAQVYLGVMNRSTFILPEPVFTCDDEIWNGDEEAVSYSPSRVHSLLRNSSVCFQLCFFCFACLNGPWS